MRGPQLAGNGEMKRGMMNFLGVLICKLEGKVYRSVTFFKVFVFRKSFSKYKADIKMFYFSWLVGSCCT